MFSDVKETMCIETYDDMMTFTQHRISVKKFKALKKNQIANLDVKNTINEINPDPPKIAYLRRGG